MQGLFLNFCPKHQTEERDSKHTWTHSDCASSAVGPVFSRRCLVSSSFCAGTLWSRGRRCVWRRLTFSLICLQLLQKRLFFDASSSPTFCLLSHASPLVLPPPPPTQNKYSVKVLTLRETFGRGRSEDMSRVRTKVLKWLFSFKENDTQLKKQKEDGNL